MIQTILAVHPNADVYGWIVVGLISVLLTVLGWFLKHRITKQDVTIKDIYDKLDDLLESLNDKVGDLTKKVNSDCIGLSDMLNVKVEGLSKETSELKVEMYEKFVLYDTYKSGFNDLRGDFKRVEGKLENLHTLLTETLLKLGGK